MGRKLLGGKKNKCEHCSKEFIPKNYHWEQRFCSRKCAGKANGFKNKKAWNKGLVGYRKGYIMTREQKIKIGNSNRKKHKDNVTPVKNLIRSQFLYREWRAKIYERDDYTCQVCGERSKAGKRKEIHAHHIKHLADIIREFEIKTIQDAQNCGELWEINNGITMCVDCHKMAHNWKVVDYTGNENIIKNGQPIIWKKTEKIQKKTEK